MPEVGDFSRHLQAVDTRLLQRSSNQGWASRCVCGSGVRSEFYNACFECRELSQDVKPGEKAPLLDQSFHWRAQEIAAAPTAATVPEDIASSFGQPSNRVTRARVPPSDDLTNSRDRFVNARSPRRSPSSPYRTFTQRGRPPNGSRPGPPGFKGVRQRKGVRGYLVEIRPPKWKRTIWLGTYNTDREAAGAYDAGIFYTNKKTKYNFPDLEGSFPTLPSQLRLDNPDDSEEIKTFVQKEAREAARKVKSLLTAETSATSTVTTQNVAVASDMSSNEESSEHRETGNIHIPWDDELVWPVGYSEVSASLLDDLLGNVCFQQAANWTHMTSFELKQEDIALAGLDGANGGLM